MQVNADDVPDATAKISPRLSPKGPGPIEGVNALIAWLTMGSTGSKE